MTWKILPCAKIKTKSSAHVARAFANKTVQNVRSIEKRNKALLNKDVAIIYILIT